MSERDREKWNKKYQETDNRLDAASNVLRSLDELLPTSGRALDVAGGRGRNAIWLAQRGLDVTIVDISPVGLSQATQFARQSNVELQTIERDVECDSLPPGPWDLILSVCFLHRELFEDFAEALVPGGLLVFLQPTETNLQRHEKPPMPFLLQDGELPGLVSGLDVIRYEEGWLADGRHDALLVAKRP